MRLPSSYPVLTNQLEKISGREKMRGVYLFLRLGHQIQNCWLTVRNGCWRRWNTVFSWRGHFLSGLILKLLFSYPCSWGLSQSNQTYCRNLSEFSTGEILRPRWLLTCLGFSTDWKWIRMNHLHSYCFEQDSRQRGVLLCPRHPLNMQDCIGHFWKIECMHPY